MKFVKNEITTNKRPGVHIAQPVGQAVGGHKPATQHLIYGGKGNVGMKLRVIFVFARLLFYAQIALKKTPILCRISLCFFVKLIG